MAIKAEFLQAALKARATKKPAAPHRVLSETHHGLTFSAAFDGGNLYDVEAVSGASSHSMRAVTARAHPSPPARARGSPFRARRGAGPHTHFEVRMSNQAKLFGHDHRPCYRALRSQPTWTRLPQPTPCVVDGATTDSFAIQITHTVDTPADDTLFFAFCFPHGYADLMASLAWADALFRQPTASLAPAGRDGEAGWARAVHLLQTTAERRRPSLPHRQRPRAHRPREGGGSGGTPAPVSADQMRVYRAKRLAQAARSAALQASVGMSEREQPADAAAAASTSHHHIAVADAAAAQAALLLPSEKSDPGGGRQRWAGKHLLPA